MCTLFITAVFRNTWAQDHNAIICQQLIVLDCCQKVKLCLQIIN